MCQINMISSIKIYRCFTFYIHFTGYVSRLLRLSPFLRKFTARTPSTNSILIRQDFFFAPLHSVSEKKEIIIINHIITASTKENVCVQLEKSLCSAVWYLLNIVYVMPKTINVWWGSSAQSIFSSRVCDNTIFTCNLYVKLEVLLSSAHTNKT